ncbi:DUF4405 domain-containing protein [Devosia salina]|uniref:DUF4405 domain-containing protein n=1 Tax=Devosia salina TaxID=2860336 RepID=A0ABX8WHM1_9HYPH|nr:DUF4405 domain-containing protein [Devosia salina]QYO78383.1 DUF4405 domain-containing protein [Devosia salina]
MTTRPSTRIAVAITAAILFVLGLVYWWQGNLFHEVVGTLFLVLLILHNVAVLRWYSALGKGKWTVRRTYSTVVNAFILLLMLSLVVTSILVSQSLFAALPINIGYAAREAHVIVAYWALVAMGLHLGLHWSRVLAVVQKAAPVVSTAAGTMIARVLALVIAIYGVQSSLVMLLPEKLLAIPALDMWDFTIDAGGFFIRYAAIVGLFVVIGHSLATGLQAFRGAPART